MVQASLCLGSWSRHDLVVMEDVMAAVKTPTKKRKSLASQESVEV